MLWGLGRDLRGSWAGALPNRSRMSPAWPPAPFLPLMMRAIAAGDGVAGAGGDEYVNAK
jgi:hypothetical protein